MRRRVCLLGLALLATGCSFDATGLPTDTSQDAMTQFPDIGPPTPDMRVDRRSLPDQLVVPDMAPPAPDGPTCAWGYRRKLTFAASTLTEDLTGVPVLVALEGSRVDYAKLLPGGGDLRFTDADGVSPLPHEIEHWDPKGRSFVWVKVPQIDKGSTVDHIWLYYGNPSPKPSPSPIAGAVWSNGYLGVWHLDDDPAAAAPQIKDSSSPKTDLFVQGGIPQKALAPGKVGLGLRLDGASHYLTGKFAAPLKLFTLEAWIWPDVVNTEERHIVELNGIQFFVESNGKLEAGTANEYDINGPTVLQAKAWYHVAFVQGAAGWAIYLNGKLETGGTQISSPGGDIYVGHVYQPGYPNSTYFAGQMDEVRISGVDRAPAWMAAQHRSMSDTLLGYGSEQKTTAVCPP
jgi:hypothetical protein